MPIYEYRCGECGHVFEQLQGFSDPPPDQCPSCQGAEVSRLISRSSFKLEGGGWYADDYGSAPAQDSPSEPADGGGDEGSASAGSADATADANSKLEPAAE